MIHLALSVLCFLACVASLKAVWYGDYSVAHMPQYNDQREDSDVAPGQEEYSDRSPDAPARLDYKYEEELHGKSDDLPVKEFVDKRIWDKPIKKKRKPSILRSGTNYALDKYTLDERERDQKPDKRFVMHKSEFRNRNFAKQSDSKRHLKHQTIDESDDIGTIENNSDYVHKQDAERVDDDDTLEFNHIRYRSTTQRKPRRKPRDRALRPPEWRESKNNAKLEMEEVDARSDRENSEIKSPRRIDTLIHQEGVNRKIKNNYDYDEYYDMKRVQYMKSQLPELLRRSTVRTMEAKSTSYSAHWLNRRAHSFGAYSTSSPNVTEVTSGVTITIRASSITTTTTGTTSEIKSTVGNTSDLSMAEKSRLSILKKAQRKESLRNMSPSTKPPVLMQVTRKMQTVVMVEPRPPDTAMRAREVLDDSPERLQRARRLMRQKLVAGAQSIHDLTENWDEMICDYIDVSLLDTDAASHVGNNRYIIFTALYVVCIVVNFSEQYILF